MKRKFYDMVFAQASIRMFLMDVAIYYHKQNDLSESLRMLCRGYCNNANIARNLLTNPNFNSECFNEMLNGYEMTKNKDFEVNNRWGMAELLISCEYMPEDRLRKFSKSKEKYTRAVTK